MATNEINGDALMDKLRTLSMGHTTPTDLHTQPTVNTPQKDTSQLQVASAPSTVLVSQKVLSQRSPSSSRSKRVVSTPPSKDKRTASAALGVAVPASPRNTSRRSSSNIVPSPSSVTLQKPETATNKPDESSPTAATVACAHFRRELRQHDQSEVVENLKTVVIVHDSCYGHRYSRPRTTKANLSTIVERPERIQASLLGVAAAYVRLGRKYTEGLQSNSLEPNSGLPTGLPFRIQKTTRSVDLTSPVITNIHGTKWMEELKIMCDLAESKLALSGKELVRPDGENTTNASNAPGGKPKLHEGDLYLCSESLDALQGAIGGVCDGVDAVFSGQGKGIGARRSFVCIRPPGHHCSSSYPSGFCWLNNVHVGISYASMVHGLTHAAIIDFDLHHGDGSQAITWDHNAKVARLPKNAANSKKTAIGYFSLHDINSYPCEMGDEEKIRNASVCLEQAHGQTIWNIHLDSWKDENEFWSIYETKYSILIDKARNFLCSYTERLKNSSSQPSPKAAIFLSAGFDASEWESSGMQRHKVNVLTSFYARFTRDIVLLSKEIETGVDERIISVLEGGYSDMALTSGVLSHLTGLAAEESTAEGQQGNGLGYEMRKRIGTYDAESKITDQTPTVELNHEWWDRQRLEELEAIVNPAAPPPAPKKSRNATRPTYSSTTESFNAKIVPGSTIYRNISAGSPRPADLPSLRAPTPTQPDIHWYTATHELNKLLIPTDRQTSSCKPEDLSAPASRVRRERYSIGLPSEVEIHDGKRMQLRERKIKTPSYALDEEEEQLQAKRPAPKTSRRTTIGGAAIQAGKPATKAESIKAEKSKSSKANSKRRPSISSNCSIANTDAPPVPKITSDATQVNDGVPKPIGHYSKRSLSILSHSSSDKQAVAGDTGNISGPRPEGAKNRPSKRATPVVKGLPAQPDRPIKSFSPTQSITPATQSNIQIPSQTQLKQECDDLASGLKKLSIEQVSLAKHEGAKETFNAGEGIILNQISHPNQAEREVTRALSDNPPSGTTNSATSEPALSEDDLEREKPQYIKQDNDLLSNEQDSTMTLQSAFLPIAITPSEPRLDPGIPMIDGRDPGIIGQAKPTSSADHGTLESTSATTGNGANAGVTQGLSQPFSPRHKGDLPVFTAKSLIPFGKAIADSSHSKAEQPASRSHMPSTSDTMRTLPEDCQGGANDSGFPVTQEMTSNEQQMKDVWDVPETPQSRK